MKKFFIILTAMLFANIQLVFANENDSIKVVDLSFEQAYQLMLENNNSLKAYNEAIEKSKFEKRAALGEFSPKFVMNSTYIHFSDQMTLNTPVTIPGLGSMTTTSLIQDNNLFTLGGGVVWNIFTGGKMLSSHAAARAKYEISNAKYKEVKDQLTVELVKRYYGLRLAKDVAETRRQHVECVSKHLKDAKSLEKNGIISKAERLHAEVAYADAKRDYDSSLRDVTIIEESLKALIKSENANLKNVQITPISLMFISEDININIDEMKINTIKNNLQLKQLLEKQKIMSAAYHAKTADYMPTISLFATDIMAASHLSEAIPRASIGATANLLLFDGLKRENNVLAAKHERKMVEYEIEDAKYNIETLVVKQYEELMKAKGNFESSKPSLEKAEEALRVAEWAFQEGYGTSLQVTDAQLALLKIKTDRLNSIYNFDVTLTELLKTNGDTNEIIHYMEILKKIDI